MGVASYSGASSVIKPGVVTTATRPSSPFVGQLIYDTTLSQTLAYNGSAWVVQTGGLTLIKTQTIGTAVSSVTVSDAFSATYNHYKILVSGGVASSNTYFRLALGAATTNYYNKVIYGVVTNNTVSGIGYSSSPGWDLVGCTNLSGMLANIDLYSPFTTTTTNFSAIISETTYDPTNAYGTVAGVHNAATSFTGFTLSPLGGTITGGTIRVYGYANS